MSNFTAGRRRENSSIAFGKTAVSNEPLGNAFFRNDALQRCKEAGRHRKKIETCEKGGDRGR